MKRPFFVVGLTATGKSELAADLARRFDAEIVGADAFQIYRGLDLLTAKPDRATLAKAPHHLIGTVPLDAEMNAEKYRASAEAIIEEIYARGKPVIVVGGSGLYVRALTHGLARLPAADVRLRSKLEQASLEELFRSLSRLDPDGALRIDRKNRRRLVRAVEICLLTGKPFSEFRSQPEEKTRAAGGVFVYREKPDLYARINRRVEQMFQAGIVGEVRAQECIGPTAQQTLGLREIQALLAGEISESECIAKIQQATRRYAKRQLTWFRRQTNFTPLNLSAHRSSEALEFISQSMARVFDRG